MSEVPTLFVVGFFVVVSQIAYVRVEELSPTTVPVFSMLIFR